MLSAFRRTGPAQYVLGVVVVLIILAFALEFRATARSGQTGSFVRECAVKVLGRCVDEKEFRSAEGLIVAGLPPSRQRAMKIHTEILDGLVERELLLIEAERLGVGVTDDQVTDDILEGWARVSLPVAKAQLLGFQLQLGAPYGPEGVRVLPVKSTQTNQFDQRMYERSIRRWANRSPAQFKEMQAKEIVAQRMRDLVRSQVRVSEAEAWKKYEAEKSTVVVRTVLARRDWFAKWAVDQSDAAVDAWAAQNASQVDEAWKTAEPAWKAGCARAREIVVQVEKDAAESTRAEARSRAEAAAKAVSEGASFAIEARRASEGAAAVVGGEIGCVGEAYGTGHAEVAAALEKLKPGETSGVVESPRGFHVLQVIGRVTEKEVVTVGRRTVARALAVRFQADEAARAFVVKLLDRAKKGERFEDITHALVREVVLPLEAAKPGKGPKPAKPAAPATEGEEPTAAAVPEHPGVEAEDRPKLDISSPLTRAGVLSGAPLPSEKLMDRVFALTAPDQVIPDVVQSAEGFLAVQLKERQAATREEFAKERIALMRQLAHEKQEEALVRYLVRLRAQASGKIETLARLAEEPSGKDSEQ